MKTTVAKIVYSPCPPSSKDVIWGKTVNGKIEFQTFGNEGWKTVAKEDILKDIFQIKEEILEELEDYIEEVTSQADWNQNDSEAVNYILNKPAIKAGQGEKSIIEGDIDNNVAGNFSHAEGGHTQASGYDSHAEGGGTKASGSTSHAEGGSTTASGDYSHTEGGGTTASGVSSHAEGGGTTASGSISHAEGQGTTASGDYSHAEGGNTTASGPISHAEGGGTKASGFCSHAEGGGTTASEGSSHAEGQSTTASGFASHTEGGGTTASASYSHTEGQGTTASGDESHAEGYNTIANHKSQHVFGEYNGVDPSTASSDARGNYIEIVGNGANDNARSNARTLDWQGNEVLAGTITANGVNLNEEINLKEPLLPAAPEQPESKFLNANKQWVEIGGSGQTTVYKSITIENPTASENMCIFYAPVAMTITEIRGVITGATSVSFKVVSGTSRNAVTTEHNSSAVVCSSVTTGDVATITTAAVAAGSWVAVKTSAVSGAPSELVITLSLNY